MKKQAKKLLMVLVAGIMFCGCKQNIESPDVAGNRQVQQETGEEGSTQEVTYQQISMDDAKKLMAEEEGFVILDARTEEEYAGGHIPGAICIPNETIGTEEPAELPEKDQLILVYCRSGNRSKQAAEKLARLGYTNVKEFGGIRDWDGEIEQ